MFILSLILKLIFKLPIFIKLKLAGGKQIEIEGRKLDLDLQIIASSGGRAPQLDTLPPKEARRNFKLMTAILRSPVRKNQTIESRQIPSNEGEIGLRIFRPSELKAKAPCIIYFHGGGNVIGDLDSYSGLCSDFAAECCACVVSVDYRLAPEYKFPTAAQDALAAYQWVLQNANEIDIDPDNICVAGESAGGYLSSLVSIQARDMSIPLPKAQVLIYPMTDMRMNTPSYKTFGKGFILTAKLMQYFIEHYLVNEEDKLNPLASPLLTDNLNGLPPTLLTVAGFDPLHDEGLALAVKLKSAGNQIEVLKHMNMTHGFVTMSGVLASAELANKEIFEKTKQLLLAPRAKAEQGAEIIERSS